MVAFHLNMRIFLALFAFNFAYGKCAALEWEETSTNYGQIVDEINHEIKQASLQLANALEQRYAEVLLEPGQKVDAAVQRLEQRKQKSAQSENCVLAQEMPIISAVDTMHEDVNACGTLASKTSSEIMFDVNAATQQIIFDGREVAVVHEKCKSYNNTIMINSCNGRLSLKATLYLKNARHSLKVINESAIERVPNVVLDTDTCTRNATERALIQLNAISNQVDLCMTQYVE